MSGSLLDWRPKSAPPRGSSRGRRESPYAIEEDGRFDLRELTAPENLMYSYRMLEWHGGHAPGVDGITFEDLSPSEAYAGFRAVSERLLAGDYRPLPHRKAKIKKPNGKKRTLSIPALLDKVVAKALQLCLKEVWGAIYPDQFKSPETIFAEIERHIRDTGQMVFPTADITDYFPSFHITDVMEAHNVRFSDPYLLRIIEQVVRGYHRHEHTRGLAQGCPFSPLAADVTLRDFLSQDMEVQGDTTPLLHWRYVDNYIFSCESAHDGHRAIDMYARALKRRGLTLRRTGVINLLDAKATGTPILGLIPHWDGQLTWSIPGKTWRGLEAKLLECWIHRRPHDTCRQVLEGAINFLGPALMTADLTEIVTKARKLASRHYLIPPSIPRLLSKAEAAVKRWNQRRDKVLQGTKDLPSCIDLAGAAAPPLLQDDDLGPPFDPN